MIADVFMLMKQGRFGRCKTLPPSTWRRCEASPLLGQCLSKVMTGTPNNASPSGRTLLI
jgi:hypothetical protein